MTECFDVKSDMPARCVPIVNRLVRTHLRVLHDLSCGTFVATAASQQWHGGRPHHFTTDESKRAVEVLPLICLFSCVLSIHPSRSFV
jgi:hypothetical protein